MHDITEIDETFDVNQSNNYFLVMQSSKDGFSFIIKDTIRNKCILMRHYTCSCIDWKEYESFITPILRQDEYLQLSYKRVIHTLTTQEFAIVPESFGSDGLKPKDYFPHLEADGSYSLRTSFSKESKSLLAFFYPKYLETLLLETFKEVTLTHHCFPFIHGIVTESVRNLRHTFNLILHKGFMTVGVSHLGNLDYVNIFKTESFEDILFYSLSILDQFNASPSFSEMFLVKETDGQETLLEDLKTYIGKLRPNKPPQNLVYSYALSESNLARFTNLLYLFNCE